MNRLDQFIEEISNANTFKGESIILGASMLDGQVNKENLVRIPLKTMNRHGLIAGATGTGKTKTLQIIAEQLSEKGVPSLLMDIKGDLSGIAEKADSNPKLVERNDKIGIPFIASSSPVELMSLSAEKGVRLRATVSEFGPVLFSKILDLNDTQQGLVALIFKFCDDNQLPLLDLADIKKVLQFISNEGKDSIEQEYGKISTSSSGTILRKIIELEQQGGDLFFGERSFDVDDLCRVNNQGQGIVSILRVTDIQDRPKLFSTFMLQILAEIYSTFPEEGDMDRPKLCMFIDEAHLVFEEASKELLNQIETIVKLIRSKGVGVYFVTQNPDDVPDDVLSQLGLKVQHALRAFTAKDRKSIKLAAQNFPISEYYDVDNLLTSMGIGEALVTALNEKGIPTPLVRTYLRAPQSRMDVLTDQEIDGIISKSRLIPKYNEEINRESAYEILTEKMDRMHESEEETPKSSSRRAEKSTFDKILNSTTTRQIGRTVAREVTRSIMGILGIKKTTSRKKSSGWF